MTVVNSATIGASGNAFLRGIEADTVTAGSSGAITVDSTTGAIWASGVGIYAQAAVHNGLTVDEIKEILIHATSYCGTPAGRQCFLAVHAALESIDALPKAAT